MAYNKIFKVGWGCNWQREGVHAAQELQSPGTGRHDQMISDDRGRACRANCVPLTLQQHPTGCMGGPLLSIALL